MKIIDVVPKDIVVLAELSLSQIDSILFCLDRTTIEYDTTDSDAVAHVDYVVGALYQTLVALKEGRLANGS